MAASEPSAAPAGLSRHPRILRPLSSRQPVKRYLAVPAPPCKAAKMQQELHGPLVYDERNPRGALVYPEAAVAVAAPMLWPSSRAEHALAAASLDATADASRKAVEAERPSWLPALYRVMERGSDGEWSILATPDAAVPPVAVGILGADPACQLLAPPTRRISKHEEADAVVEEDDEAGEEEGEVVGLATEEVGAAAEEVGVPSEKAEEAETEAEAEAERLAPEHWLAAAAEAEAEAEAERLAAETQAAAAGAQAGGAHSVPWRAPPPQQRPPTELDLFASFFPKHGPEICPEMMSEEPPTDTALHAAAQASVMSAAAALETSANPGAAPGAAANAAAGAVDGSSRVAGGGGVEAVAAAAAGAAAAAAGWEVGSCSARCSARPPSVYRSLEDSLAAVADDVHDVHDVHEPFEAQQPVAEERRPGRDELRHSAVYRMLPHTPHFAAIGNHRRPHAPPGSGDSSGDSVSGDSVSGSDRMVRDAHARVRAACMQVFAQLEGPAGSA